MYSLLIQGFLSQVKKKTVRLQENGFIIKEVHYSKITIYLILKKFKEYNL